MSFSEKLDELLANPSPTVRRFIQLIQPVDDGKLEQMARESRRLTRMHFGKAMRLFAPIYLSTSVSITANTAVSRETTPLSVRPSRLMSYSKKLVTSMITVSVASCL